MDGKAARPSDTRNESENPIKEIWRIREELAEESATRGIPLINLISAFQDLSVLAFENAPFSSFRHRPLYFDFCPLAFQPFSVSVFQLSAFEKALRSLLGPFHFSAFPPFSFSAFHFLRMLANS